METYLNEIRKIATDCLNQPIYATYKPLWETVEKIKNSKTTISTVETLIKKTVGENYEVGEYKDYVWGIIPNKKWLSGGSCSICLLSGTIEIRWRHNLHIEKIEKFL